MIRDKLNTPQAIDAEFATIPVKRLSAGVSTSQYPHNQVIFKVIEKVNNTHFRIETVELMCFRMKTVSLKLHF
jgi:hypothetical protein